MTIEQNDLTNVSQSISFESKVLKRTWWWTSEITKRSEKETDFDRKKYLETDTNALFIV